MQEKRWNELVAAVRDRNDIDGAVAACRSLQNEATMEDVPRLRELLRDDDFFVREAAAWPLSDLGIIEALPDLLEALQRGEDDGHDNNGLIAAMTDLAGATPSESRTMIDEILASGDRRIREQAGWLRQLCE